MMGTTDPCIDVRYQDKNLISSTDAHDDFLKALYIFPSLALLVSGSSDKIVRFW